jgi:hypothetical protein
MNIITYSLAYLMLLANSASDIAVTLDDLEIARISSEELVSELPPVPVLECGGPVCTTIKAGEPPHTAACDSSCGTWAPGAPVSCGDIVCQPQGQPTECRWVCRPADEW